MNRSASAGGVPSDEKAKIWKVVVAQRRLTDYRVPFFELLKRGLQAERIDLVLVVGNPTRSELLKGDGSQLTWSKFEKVRYFGDRLCWQSLSSYARAADLVILPAENRMLWNLRALMLPKKYKVALWGHGKNLQEPGNYFRESFKRFVQRRADWWFCYTEMSRRIVESDGFDRGRITVVNNAVAKSQAMMAEVGVSGGCNVDRRLGVFIGAMYSEKRISFLLEAADLIRARVPDFELILIGSGPDSAEVKSWVRTRAWANYHERDNGSIKAAALNQASLLLNPGLVGLGVLDSFHSGVPMVTTNFGRHSPEIEYLVNGVNGLITDDSLDSYVDGCASLLLDRGARHAMSAACRRAADEYTLENMVQRFVTGIKRCLE